MCYIVTKHVTTARDATLCFSIFQLIAPILGPTTSRFWFPHIVFINIVFVGCFVGKMLLKSSSWQMNFALSSLKTVIVLKSLAQKNVLHYIYSWLQWSLQKSQLIQFVMPCQQMRQKMEEIVPRFIFGFLPAHKWGTNICTPYIVHLFSHFVSTSSSILRATVVLHLHLKFGVKSYNALAITHCGIVDSISFFHWMFGCSEASISCSINDFCC